MKVLFHIDEREKWKLALGNVSNMVAHGRETGKVFEIEIVANSVAVMDLQGDPSSGFSGELEELHDSGVAICACRNALRNLQIDPQNLLPFIQVVPAGVVEIAERQQDGYAYLKP